MGCGGMECRNHAPIVTLSGLHGTLKEYASTSIIIHLDHHISQGNLRILFDDQHTISRHFKTCPVPQPERPASRLPRLLIPKTPTDQCGGRCQRGLGVHVLCSFHFQRTLRRSTEFLFCNILSSLSPQQVALFPLQAFLLFLYPPGLIVTLLQPSLLFQSRATSFASRGCHSFSISHLILSSNCGQQPPSLSLCISFLPSFLLRYETITTSLGTNDDGVD